MTEDPRYLEVEAAALEEELNAESSEGENKTSDLEEELNSALSEGGNVVQDSKTDEASDVAQMLTTTSKLGVALTPTTREFTFDPTAAADDGLIITGPSFIDAVAAHCRLPTSSSAASHLTRVDVSFNIKIYDEQPLPKPPEGKPIDISEALTTDGDKPNAGDYNCIEDMYNTSKSMTSKALRSAHEAYGNSEMDHHLYTDVATMDKPCIQAIIGGDIKTFVDAKDMDTYARCEPLGVTAAIAPFNFSAMILLWPIPMAWQLLLGYLSASAPAVNNSVIAVSRVSYLTMNLFVKLLDNREGQQDSEVIDVLKIVGKECWIIQISRWLVWQQIECDVWRHNCIKMGIGSIMQMFSLTANTDSMLTWAVDASCKEADCPDLMTKNLYNARKSLTSKVLHSAHEVYGNGKVDLHLYTDIATLDKLTISSETPRPGTRRITTMDMAVAVPPPELRRMILWVFTTKRSLQLHLSAINFITSTLAQHDLLDRPFEWEEAIDALAQGIVDGQSDVDPHSSRGATCGGSQNVDNGQDTGPSDVATAAALKKFYSRLVVASSASNSDSSESDYNNVETPDAEAADQYQKDTDDFALRDFRLLGVVMSIDGQWKLLGLLPMFNPPYSDTAATTAAYEWDPFWQKCLFKAASFGKSSIELYDSTAFVDMAWMLRVLNAARNYQIGFPISYEQYIAADVVFLDKGITTIITLIKKLVEWQSIHDNNLPISKDHKREFKEKIDPADYASDTATIIAKAQSLSTSVKVLTGDAITIAKETHTMLALGTKVYDSGCLISSDGMSGLAIHNFVEAADGSAEAFPERKYQVIEMLQHHDAARSAADVVFLDKGISTIITLIKRLVKRQSTHGNNLPTSEDHNAFLKLQNMYRTRVLQDLARFKQLIGEICKSAGIEGKIADDEVGGTQMHWFDRRVPRTILILDEVIRSNLIIFITHFANVATIAVAYDNAPHIKVNVFINQDTNFTYECRDQLGLCGPLPPATQSLKAQVLHILHQLHSKAAPLEKHVIPASLPLHLSSGQCFNINCVVIDTPV
ncbi:uncharacterized protein UBRO2_05986 [Ustilago bromivora]|uniref:Peptidase A1 domain-containing protein n=1 Tax=Ustilago bromivora TaxID=307758 RepID=A0A8H8TU83_9BASI|nr:uncharacterized protein UBRO2_05986 [Ustilago bromivora]